MIHKNYWIHLVKTFTEDDVFQYDNQKEFTKPKSDNHDIKKNSNNFPGEWILGHFNDLINQIFLSGGYGV